MDVPNHFDIVQRVFDQGGHELVTKEGCGRFTEAAAAAVYAVDATMGHLKKNPGQNQYEGHAVDALLHKPTGIAIDIIADSESTRARAAWQVKDGPEEPRYSADKWLAPSAGSGGGTPPTGGGGDTAAVAALARTVAALQQQLDGFDPSWFRQKISDEDAAIMALGARIDALPPAGGGDSTVTHTLPLGTVLTFKAKFPLVGERTVTATITDVK